MTRIQFLYHGLLLDAEFTPKGADGQEAPGDAAEIDIYSIEVENDTKLESWLDPDELLEAAEGAYGETR